MILEFIKSILAGIMAGVGLVGSVILAGSLVRLFVPIEQNEIGLGLLLSFIVIMTPIFLALAGGLAVKLSGQPLAGLKRCLLWSELAGIATVLIATILFLLLMSPVSPQDIS